MTLPDVDIKTEKKIEMRNQNVLKIPEDRFPEGPRFPEGADTKLRKHYELSIKNYYCLSLKRDTQNSRRRLFGRISNVMDSWLQFLD